MLQNLVDERQILLCEDRSTSFRGTARIDIEHLKFDLQPSDEPRISTKRHKGVPKSNVERLKDIFRTEGCLPLEPENRIVAIISPVVLEQALRLSEKTQDVFLENPGGSPPVLKLPPSYQLQCLTGYSRVKAAEHFLEPGCRIWAVDLYLEDTSNDLRDVLTDQYSNQRQYSDLEIYSNVRRYHKLGDVYAEGRWRARLSANKQTRLTQFLKHDMLRASLEEVLKMPGQRFGLTLSMCHDIVSMGCDEEFVHYFRHIVTTWSEIFDGNEELMLQIDRFSVEEMQLRVPGRCLQDFKHLNPLMENGRLFPFIRDPDQRRFVWNRILKISTLIPSLHSAAQDRKFLSPIAKAIRRLCSGSLKTTLRATLRHAFSPVDRTEDIVDVQTSDHKRCQYKGSTTQQFNWGIAQLVCFASREFPNLIRECPLKEPGKSKPLPKEPDAAIWASFAQLAYHLGFKSEKILELKQKDVDEEIATTMLLLARKPPRFFYDEVEFQQHKLDIVQKFFTAHEQEYSHSSLEWVLEGEGEGLDRRCGRTFEFAHNYNQNHTFFPNFWTYQGESGEGISPLFVRFAVLKAFFGDLFGDQKPLAYPENVRDSSIHDPVDLDMDSTASISSEIDVGSEERLAQDEEAQLRAEINQLRVELESLHEVMRNEAVIREEAQKLTAVLQERVQQHSTVDEKLLQAESKIKDLSSQLDRDKLVHEAECQRYKLELDRTEQECSRKELALRQTQEITVRGDNDKARQIEELQGLLLGQETHQRHEVDALKARLSEMDETLNESLRTRTQLEDASRSRSQSYQMNLQNLQQGLAKIEDEKADLEAKLQSVLTVLTAIAQMVEHFGEIGRDLIEAPEMAISGEETDVVTDLTITSTTASSLDNQTQTLADNNFTRSEQDFSPEGALAITRTDHHAADHEQLGLVVSQDAMAGNVAADDGLRQLQDVLQRGNTAKVQIVEGIRALRANIVLLEGKRKQSDIQNDKSREATSQLRKELTAWKKKEHKSSESRKSEASTIVGLRGEIAHLQQELTVSQSRTDNEGRMRQQAELKEAEASAALEKSKAEVFSFQSQLELPKDQHQSASMGGQVRKIGFKIDPSGDERQVYLNRSELQDVLEKCKRDGLIPYDSRHHSMSPEHTWDIMMSQRLDCITLHLMEDYGMPKEGPKRKRRPEPSHESSLVVSSESSNQMIGLDDSSILVHRTNKAKAAWRLLNDHLEGLTHRDEMQTDQ